MPGAGKSIAVDHLKSKGLPSPYFGGITLDEIKKRGLEVNEANEKLVREDIRSNEGKDAYAKRILAQVNDYFKTYDAVVADGLYSWTEYKVFKDALGDNAVIIAIVTPRTLRHKRLATRPTRPLTAEEASTRDYAEIENIEKGGPIANADYYILNTGTAEDLLTDLDEILKSADINL